MLAGAPQQVDVPRDDGSSAAGLPLSDLPGGGVQPLRVLACVFVRGGTLDDPSSVVPDAHIYTRSKLPWITLPDSTPTFDEYYDSKSLWPAASLERLATVRAARQE